MVDLLITTLLVGAAVSALVEFFDMLFDIFGIGITKSTLKKALVLPAGVGGALLMGVSWPEIIIISAATMFTSLCITMWLDKPVVIQTQQRPRRTLDGLL